jgi:hypothetical protein
MFAMTRNPRLRPWVGRPPRSVREAVEGTPAGYRLGLLGIALGTFGMVGDIGWHTIFGEELGVARFIAPFHLWLFSGAALLVTIALRSAWASPRISGAPSLRELFPAVLSLSLLVGLGLFLFQWISPFMSWTPSIVPDHVPAGIASREAVLQTAEVAAIAGALIANFILIGSLLFALRRWRLPFGSATIIFTLGMFLTAGMTNWDHGAVVLAAPVAGLVADLLISRAPSRRAAMRVVGFVVPGVYWSGYFLAFALAYGRSWQLELWLGTIGWCALSGLVVSVLAHPPAQPAAAPAPGPRARSSLSVVPEAGVRAAAGVDSVVVSGYADSAAHATPHSQGA